MTVIAYDGYTLAADKQATGGGMKRSITKVFRVGDLAVGFAGASSQSMQMLEWVRAGRRPELFPDSQRDKDDWAGVVVIEGGRVLVYERTPYPILFEDPVFAYGSGRDFALAAMFLGVDARKAVAVACQFDDSCGMGIDAIEIVPRPEAE